MMKIKKMYKYFAILFFAVIVYIQAFASGRIGINFIVMAPYGSSATDFSKPGLGIGLDAVIPMKSLDQFCAFVAGAEMVNLKTKSIDVEDLETGIITEQRTAQNYFRLKAGFQIGGYGDEFIRPHGGLTLALVRYSVSTDLKNQYDEYETIEEESKFIFGCDMTFGLNLNFHNEWDIDLGVRYVKSFGLVQQLGTRLVTVHPEYFQIYLGAGISFDSIALLLP
jgi:hypothetical protein